MIDEQADRRRDFLLTLVETGDVEGSAEAVGWSPRALSRERSRDVDFDRLYGDALVLAGEPQTSDVADWSVGRLMFMLAVLRPERFARAYSETMAELARIERSAT